MKHYYIFLSVLLSLALTGCSGNSDRTSKEKSEPIKGSLQWCRMYHDPATSGERKPNAARYCEPTLERDKERERDDSILERDTKVEIKTPL